MWKIKQKSCNFAVEMRIQCVLHAIEAFAPRTLQEDYDNSGLQVGDTAKDCTGVLLSLDVTEATVKEASECGCNLIVSHHPLLFKGIKQISPASETGRIVLSAIEKGIAIYSSHTALDNALGGVSFRMAQKLGMENVKVLQPQSGKLAKLVVFVPDDYVKPVSEALFASGAGKIGNYDSCSYQMRGHGSFRALEDANPFVGGIGEVHSEPETRLEVIIPKSKIYAAVSAMIKVHPYEEPAHDIIPLENVDAYAGSGVVGDIASASLETVLARLKSVFGTGAIRYCGDAKKPIKRIALCGGSGAFLTGDAIAAGADLYVSGDFKYHDFTTFASRIAIADVGHYESEQCTKEIFKELIERNFPDLAVKMAESDIKTIKYF